MYLCDSSGGIGNACRGIWAFLFLCRACACAESTPLHANTHTHTQPRAHAQVNMYHPRWPAGAANPALASLPSAPSFPPVQLANEVPQKAKISALHSLDLAPSSTVLGGAAGAAGGARAGHGLSHGQSAPEGEGADAFGELGDYGPAIIRSDARLVYPSDGASYKVRSLIFARAQRPYLRRVRA